MCVTMADGDAMSQPSGDSAAIPAMASTLGCSDLLHLGQAETFTSPRFNDLDFDSKVKLLNKYD